jgi:polar amino acid transport system substrate-binding protein
MSVSSMTPALQKAFAPTGVLRASINLGNPILANLDAASGKPFGVSIDLAQGLADLLHVNLELVVFEMASKSVQSVETGQADIGFFAIDPKRGESIAFTAPYVLIEGSYMVRQDSALQRNEEVDQVQHRVAVGLGSAYDLYLSRTMAHAEIVRAPNSPAVVEVFLRDGLDVAAGVRQQLEMDAQRLPNLRLLPGHFMLIQQAMGIAKQRGEEAAVFLNQYVQDMKRMGFVSEALQRHQIEGATVAP